MTRTTTRYIMTLVVELENDATATIQEWAHRLAEYAEQSSDIAFADVLLTDDTDEDIDQDYDDEEGVFWRVVSTSDNGATTSVRFNDEDVARAYAAQIVGEVSHWNLNVLDAQGKATPSGRYVEAHVEREVI